MPPLNEIMDFDTVVEVLPDGRIIERNDVYAPTLHEGELDTDGWSLMSGYTGQQGGGSVMHNSEFIGGRLEEDIRSTPGLYVAVACFWCPEDEADDHTIEGWGVAMRPLEQ